MNFGDMQARLSTAILRSDLAPNYGEYINEALIEIQTRRSWICMKVSEQVSLGPGDGFETAPLQNNFKELRKPPAINFIADNGGLIPAVTVFEEEEVFRNWKWGGAPIFVWPPRVYLLTGPPNPTQLAAGFAMGASIGILNPLIEVFNLSVQMYAYLPPLVNATDMSPLINAYPNLVLEKAKALAFHNINDPEARNAEAAFEVEFIRASGQDAHSEVAGRKLRM